MLFGFFFCSPVLFRFLSWTENPFQSCEAKLYRLQKGESEMEWRNWNKGVRG